jgi:PPM family protein phosphatase
MLRVAEQYAGTDTGLQRRANEDSLLARAPLFVVADGMGGAQAGEVASRIAVESFHAGLPDAASPEQALAASALAANERIHALSRANAEHAGMGTTLTAVYVGEQEVAIAHVGDSRAYCLREGELVRLTDDHSLVDELIREGRLTPAEETVEVDTRSFRARPGDVYLLCSDGLTSMVPETRLAEILRELAGAPLREAGERLIAEANHAGGRDNITVILLRLEEVEFGSHNSHAAASLTRENLGAAPPPVARRHPRAPAPPAAARGWARRLPRALPALIALIVFAVLAAGAHLAAQSVYFIGTNARGLVTMYQGFPYRLPGGLELYSSYYVSGVGASTLSPARRAALLDHKLRSEHDAGSLMRSIELEELAR